jgi:very-short-patch-repair endonuclease
MATPNVHRARLRALIRRQHWVIARAQLLAFGYTPATIRHMLARARLHVIYPGVYAVGRSDLTREGRLMAAVLCGRPDAFISHDSAAAFWGFRPESRGRVEITVPAARRPRLQAIRVHRSRTLGAHHTTMREGIPITTPVRTLTDISPSLDRKRLERAINEADRLGLVDPEELRREIDGAGRNAAVLRKTLDRRTHRKTRSELERDFLPLAVAAGLSLPLTQQIVNGFEVDFYWPERGLIVESDGLRYHRTPAQQARERLRDQIHTAAGLTCLRFTGEQVDFEQQHVVNTLRSVARRLAA